MVKSNYSRLVLAFMLVLSGGQVHANSLIRKLWSDPNAGDPEMDKMVDNSVLPRTMEDLNSGLPVSISENIRLKKNRNYLFLLTRNPTFPLDFRNPERLRRSLQAANYSGMDIGHAMLAWSCVVPGGNRVEGATGQTGENLGQGFEMLKTGWGMTTFLSTFVDGYLNHPEEIDEDINDGSAANRLRFVGIEITGNQCGQLQAFLKRYAEGPEMAQLNFGFMKDPAKFEGAGCGSFAAVALQKADIFTASLPYLWRRLEVPRQLVGVGDVVPPQTEIYPNFTTGEKVRVTRLINSPWRNFPSTQRGLPVRIADPEMFIHMINGLEVAVANMVGAKNRSMSAESLQLKSKIRTVRASRDGGGYDMFTIDNRFDRQTGLLDTTTAAWVSNYLRAGGKPRVIAIDGHTGIMFEK